MPSCGSNGHVKNYLEYDVMSVCFDSTYTINIEYDVMTAVVEPYKNSVHIEICI